MGRKKKKKRLPKNLEVKTPSEKSCPGEWHLGFQKSKTLPMESNSQGRPSSQSL